MTSRVFLKLLCLCCLLSFQVSAEWQGRGRQKTFVIKDLPETLWSMGQPTEKKRPSAVTVFLPEDYTPTRTFPLVVYLGGARGESGHGISVAKQVFGSKGFILVSMPMYKDPEDIKIHRENPNMHELVVDPGQAELLWSAYAPMLVRVLTEVPNIDRENCFMGGFSNGAHATAALLNHPVTGPELRKIFQHFFFVEGGAALQLTMSLPDATLLFMQGEKRAPWLEKTAEPLGWNVRIDVEVRTMPGVGHAFPASEKTWLRTWVRRHVTAKD